jgi:hypothetical protein
MLLANRQTTLLNLVRAGIFINLPNKPGQGPIEQTKSAADNDLRGLLHAADFRFGTLACLCVEKEMPTQIPLQPLNAR